MIGEKHRKQANVMTITYELDLSKSNIANFSELVLTVLEQLRNCAKITLAQEAVNRVIPIA